MRHSPLWLDGKLHCAQSGFLWLVLYFVTATMYEYTVYIQVPIGTPVCRHSFSLVPWARVSLSQAGNQHVPVIILFLSLLETGNQYLAIPSFFFYLFRSLSSDLKACSASAVIHRHTSPSLFSLFKINFKKKEKKKNLANKHHTLKLTQVYTSQ